MKKKLGKKINLLRLKKDKTMSEFANAMGVSTAAVCKWEKGENFPDFELIPKIARYFNISLNELFDYDNEVINYNIEEIIKKYVQSSSSKDRLNIIKKGLQIYNDDYRLNIIDIFESINSVNTDISEKKEFVDNKCREIIKKCSNINEILLASFLYLKVIYILDKNNEELEKSLGIVKICIEMLNNENNKKEFENIPFLDIFKII
ncbi:MAG: helix-turn-helix transcriptional regulator [Bacilli bacterium]|nr:helix-turn-helix transcriptional regulator [Bacilli bacterium]